MEFNLSLGISLLILLALIFLGWPLLKGKITLPKTWLSLIVILPLTTLGAYWTLGSPYHLLMVKPQNNQSETSLVEKLEIKLQKNSTNTAEWMLLARSHFTLKNYAKAEVAYRRVLQLTPDNTNALLGLADSLGMQKNGILLGEPAELIEKSRALEPLNPLGLQLSATLEMQQGNPIEAKKYLTQLKGLLHANPASADSKNPTP